MSLWGHTASSFKGHGNQGRFLRTAEKANATLIFENRRDYRLISLISVPRKVMEQIHSEVISKLMKDW